jgi:hypothetical protein
VILKIFPKAGNDIYTGENRPLTPKESQSDAAFKQSSELVSVFKESSRNF